MTINKNLRYLFVSIITLSLISAFISSLSLSQSFNNQADSTNNISSDGFYIPLAISQQNTTDLTNTTTTTGTTTEGTNTTDDTRALTPWNPLVDEGLYYPFALIFSVLGIFSTLWLIFFVETSKERTVRERIIGSAIRLIIMSVMVGLAIHFWILFEPI